jgi:hypothetical protein
MINEIWKDAVGFEGAYQVSSLGNIRSLDRKVNSSIKNNKTILKKGIPIKVCYDKYGYLKCMLKRKNKTVHRLVAEAFIPNPLNKAQVNHINGIKTDNRVENLEWVTNEENIKKGVELKLFLYGSSHKMSKLTEKEVVEIRNKYDKKNYNSYRLSREYNVSRTLINYIVSRKNWKHV